MNKLSFQTITRRIDSLEFPDCELVVGIASGGVVPASLIAYKLNRPLRIIKFNYRDRDNNPQHPKPVLLSKICLAKDVGKELVRQMRKSK